MVSKSQRSRRNKMNNQDIAIRFRDIDWLNVNMLLHGLITEPCANLGAAYDILARYFFCIRQFANGNFKPFRNFTHLQKYILNAGHKNGFNPLKYPVALAKEYGFSCLLVRIGN